MSKETFLATDSWTCPSDTTGAMVTVFGPGGNGSSDAGGGGGAWARSFIDVVPDQVYDIEVATGGSEDKSYFDTEDNVAAEGGKNSSSSTGADGGGVFEDWCGQIRSHGGRGGDGAPSGGGGAGGGDSLSNAGGSSPIGTFYSDDLNGGSGGDSGAPGEAPGGGGGDGNSDGADGGVQVDFWPTLSGNGGGGGGGYARSVITVTPETEYDLYVGHPGYGQRAKISDPPSAVFNLPVHGEDSWFGDSLTLRATGGRSAGSDTGDEDEAIATGAAGGGTSPDTDPCIGDVTFNGGYGGNGNTASQYFPQVGGGGGAAGGFASDGPDGIQGREGGYGGHSVNDLNYHMLDGSLRQGAGGYGETDNLIGNKNNINGRFPGGGAGGCRFFCDATFTIGNSSTGGAGRVLISGQCTGRLLIPGF